MISVTCMYFWLLHYYFFSRRICHYMGEILHIIICQTVVFFFFFLSYMSKSLPLPIIIYFWHCRLKTYDIIYNLITYIINKEMELSSNVHYFSFIKFPNFVIFLTVPCWWWTQKYVAAGKFYKAKETSVRACTYDDKS